MLSSVRNELLEKFIHFGFNHYSEFNILKTGSMMAGTEQHYRRILRTGIWYYLNLKLGILCFGIQLFFDSSFENGSRIICPGENFKSLILKKWEQDGWSRGGAGRT